MDSTDNKKLDADMYENATDEEESEDEDYLDNIKEDKASLLSI